MRLRRSRRAFNGSLLAGSFAALSLAACSGPQSRTVIAGRPAPGGTPSIGLRPGELAPEFALTTIDGKLISGADFRAQKRPYILFFFATW